ncbi:hypothetical protein FSP39_004613 [Pinctada imbricata]|uniref:Uncharacterized protein n=1 Tax=Pinctada imbricata TaxID=66713 RepID=A0AA88Y4W1_PINIB|nr:hypothetical protein FSP39_004613 [Pinctada imbricata]
MIITESFIKIHDMPWPAVFGIKEKSYEEAIAEQRRRLEEEQEKHRKDRKAEKDKKKKKPPKEKPVKEKPPSPVPSPIPVIEPEISMKEHKMVNLEIDPEIIEPLMSEKHTKPSKKKPSKPILHNKDEKPLVSKETQEVIHHIPHPKDDVELKHEHDKKVKRPDRQKADSPRESKREKKVVEEEIFVERMSKQMAAPPVESVPKKSKNAVNSALEDASSLMTSVRSAQLNDQDTQTLIEILLNKQGGGSSMISTEWNKKVQKGDPVALLRKQLEEKERSLQEEQQLAMANNNKCKELKADMVKEKARYTALETQYQEKIAAQTQEIQALHTKMRSSHDHNLIESSKLQAHIQQLESQIGGGGRLKEENQVLKETIERMKAEAIPVAEFNSLRQKVSIMENELSNNVTKLSSAEKAKKTLEQKCNKMEEDMKKSKSSESQAEGVWSKRLDEVNAQLRKTEADKAGLTEKLKAAEKDCATVKTRLQELEKTLSTTDSKDMEEKLKNVEKSKTQAENSLKSAEQKLSETEQQKKTLQTEIEKLKQENNTLNTEVKTLKERPLGGGQDTKPNGDIHDETSETKITVTQHEKLISEKESQIQKLMADMESKKNEVSSLQEQMETQKKKNNELREKNWKAMDALEKAEKSASDKIQSATKDLKVQTQSAVIESEKNDQAILKRLFPEVKVNEKLGHKDWMSSFEKETAVYLTSLSNKATDSATDSAKVKEVEDENKSLQTQLQDVQARLSSESAKLKDLEVKNQKLEMQLSDSKNVISNKLADTEARVKDLESSNEKLQSQLEKQKSIEESNRQLQSELTQAVTYKQTVEELQSQLTTQKAESEKQNTGSSSQVAELEDENQKLKSQNQEYLSVLKVTETKLQQLENSVEGEERKWQSKAESLQIDLRQAKEELESLREQLKRLQGSEEALAELDFAYRCLEKSLTQITDEMQEKVQNLEEQLKKSEDKCSGLQSQVNEAEERISSLQITINKSADTDNDDLLKQIAELKASLEKEQKKSKELATQTVKLNGIIKTGHDALIQEQDLVKKLQQQLEAGKEGSGTTNASKEVKELKSKLAEKEKLLDREITSNKQLSQRLTSSQSSLNEAGTSV